LRHISRIEEHLEGEDEDKERDEEPRASKYVPEGYLRDDAYEDEQPQHDGEAE
jgi:hypothetical protein